MDKQKINYLLSNIFWIDHVENNTLSTKYRTNNPSLWFLNDHQFQEFHCGVFNILLLKRENTLVLHTHFDVKDKKRSWLILR